MTVHLSSLCRPYLPPGARPACVLLRHRFSKTSFPPCTNGSGPCVSDCYEWCTPSERQHWATSQEFGKMYASGGGEITLCLRLKVKVDPLKVLYMDGKASHWLRSVTKFTRRHSLEPYEQPCAFFTAYHLHCQRAIHRSWGKKEETCDVSKAALAVSTL